MIFPLTPRPDAIEIIERGDLSLLKKLDKSPNKLLMPVSKRQIVLPATFYKKK
uniref:Uncharacterized protein n=1 Tax=Bacteriophage sp. TaxID=38018 RepID=A0A7G9A4T6_9VIRU|nr:MAG: hypothetical protein [Bacteriophage sp.]